MDPKLIEAIESVAQPNWTGVVTAVAAVVGVLVTAFGLLFVARQITVASQTASANFVLQLESEFADHLTDTYSKFLPESVWAPDQPGPASPKDVAELERYLDFFGMLQILREKRFLDLDLIDQMFSYRLFIAVNNPHAIKLVNVKKEFWGNLFNLCRDLTEFRGKKPMPNPQHSFLAVAPAAVA